MKLCRLFFLSVLGVSLMSARAQQTSILEGNALITDVKVEQTAERMLVSFDVEPREAWKVASNHVITLSPLLQQGVNTAHLPAIEIRGRRQYIYHQRNPKLTPASTRVYAARKTGKIHYEASLDYEDWMKQAVLLLDEDLCGCCRTPIGTAQYAVSEYDHSPYRPVFAYIQPEAEPVKARSESGQAYINFRLSRTEIDATYLNNYAELQKILETIHLYKKDPDVTITRLSIKGYASPEGSYEQNRILAQGRTAAVTQYVRQQLDESCSFDIATSFEPEDWAGLRDYVSRSSLSDKEGLLRIIDSPEFSRQPDAREWKLKSTYPEAYQHLLSVCYPHLRRTDYRVDFQVRAFTPDEARDIILRSPQKLSLQEMYQVALTYPVGSDEYNEVFNTAVRMFPDDATANLNAANSAMQRNDLTLAEKYLRKAGNSGEAILARGILAMLKGDRATAERLMKQAKELGIAAADQNLKELNSKQ